MMLIKLYFTVEAFKMDFEDHRRNLYPSKGLASNSAFLFTTSGKLIKEALLLLQTVEES